MVRRRVAVVMGGVSAEREISLSTGRAVAKALARSQKVEVVEILGDGWWVLPARKSDRGRAVPYKDRLASAGEAVAHLKQEGVDVVFNALHGPWGEDGAIQGLLRWAGLAFTGPDVTAAAVTMDKVLTKEVLRGAGIRTPRWFVVPNPVMADPLWEDFPSFLAAAARDVPRPWFAKPRRSGSSVGVATFDDAESFLSFAASWQRTGVGPLGTDGPEGPDDLLVEERVSGRELSCAVVALDGRPRALAPIEIVPRHGPVFDWQAKYTPGGATETCPAPLDRGADSAVRELALRIHRTFGCGALSRTDFFLEGDGSLTVLEVNTLPGMTPTSLVPLAAAEAGLSLEDLCLGLVDEAYRRHERARRAFDPGVGFRYALARG